MTKKLENVYIVELASPDDTCQHEVFFDGTLCETTIGMPAKLRKAFDRIFCGVVVPRDAIMIQEREHLCNALLEPLPVVVGQFGREIPRNHRIFDPVISVGLGLSPNPIGIFVSEPCFTVRPEKAFSGTF